MSWPILAAGHKVMGFSKKKKWGVMAVGVYIVMVRT
jgi:hypothetical protein